jgi:predicted Mrr-cat superfamily restriction endonuclease
MGDIKEKEEVKKVENLTLDKVADLLQEILKRYKEEYDKANTLEEIAIIQDRLWFRIDRIILDIKHPMYPIEKKTKENMCTKCDKETESLITICKKCNVKYCYECVIELNM